MCFNEDSRGILDADDGCVGAPGLVVWPTRARGRLSDPHGFPDCSPLIKALVFGRGFLRLGGGFC